MAFFVKKEEENVIKGKDDVIEDNRDNRDWDVWIKGAEVAKFLEYDDTNQAIRDHIDKNNKIIFSNLVKFFGPSKTR